MLMPQGGVGFKFIGNVDAVSRKPIIFGTTESPNQPANFEINGKALEVTSNDDKYFELFWNNGAITSMRLRADVNYPVNTLDASNLNTSQITDMSNMFQHDDGLTFLNLSNWNVSQVTNMSGMFYNDRSLSSIDLSNWNASQVTDMSIMFAGDFSLNSLDLSNFDTSQVTNMEQTFRGCYGLVSLDLSNWNTSRVTNMEMILSGCSSLRSIKINDEASANKLIAQIKLDIEKDARWDSTTKLITIPE